MKIHFSKYHGTGNDFVLINNLDNKLRKLTAQEINYICNRNLGIGADGLMILNTGKEYDFEMHYYNSDGSSGMMCGNGGRCITAFAKKCGVISTQARFLAGDGEHLAFIDSDNVVDLKMMDVSEFTKYTNHYQLNTGAPHYVTFVEELDNYDVFNKGKSIRYDPKFSEKGTNVNFINYSDNTLFVRTYERGVENETLSCGTGVTASAIALYLEKHITGCKIKTLGGELEVKFKPIENQFNDVWLKGKATFVFEGNIEI